MISVFTDLAEVKQYVDKAVADEQFQLFSKGLLFCESGVQIQDLKNLKELFNVVDEKYCFSVGDNYIYVQKLSSINNSFESSFFFVDKTIEEWLMKKSNAAA